jgi:hypothetical protein
VGSVRAVREVSRSGQTRRRALLAASLVAIGAPLAAQELTTVRIAVPTTAAVDSVRRLGVDVVEVHRGPGRGATLVAVASPRDRALLLSRGYRITEVPRAPLLAAQEERRQALKAAAEVPRETVRAAYGVLEVAAELVEKGNPNLITDVGVAAKFGVAALECAALNVEINLAYIKDEQYNAAVRSEMAPMLKRGPEMGVDVWAGVNERMRG